MAYALGGRESNATDFACKDTLREIRGRWSKIGAKRTGGTLKWSV